MDSSGFVKNHLYKLIKEFPKTKVRYENHTLSRTHFIEVVPNSIYYLDDKYIKWESDVIDEFISQFPNENICFISDDALVGIENAEFVLLGDEFVLNAYTTIQQIGLIESTPTSEFEFITIEKEEIHNNRKNIEFNIPISLISFINSKNYYPKLASKPAGDCLKKLGHSEEYPLAA